MKTTRKALSVLGVVLAMSLLVVALVPASPVSATTLEKLPVIAEKRAEIKANRERNVALAQENHELRAALKAQLAEVRDGLEQETKDGLKTIRVSLKSTVAELRATKGDIREAWTTNPLLIPGIQQYRFQKLTSIHQLLQEMVDLVS